MDNEFLSDIHSLKYEYERNSKIILYGASIDGKKTYEVLDALGIQISYVIDSHLGNSGKYLYKAEIALPERLKNENGRICIILCSKAFTGEMFATVKNIPNNAEMLIFYSQDGIIKKPKNDLELFKLHQIGKNIYSKDLLALTHKIATETTAAYVYKNMVCVPTFPSHEILRAYAVSFIKAEGIVLEFGVFQGKSINALADFLKDRLIYGFDSFEGLPEDWVYGTFKGHFDVQGILPRVKENVVLIKGWFNETLPSFIDQHKGETCAFIHIDCDLYSSAEMVLSSLSSMITTGTIIVFDEYFNYPGWEEGEFRAFKEFLEETGFQYRYLGYVSTGEAVAIQIV